MINGGGSEVVRLMEQRSRETYRAWRKQVDADAGTADTPEAVKLWEESQLSGKVLMGELAARIEVAKARAS